MTEEQWLAGIGMRRMLHFARASRVSERKLRLFAVSCCRLVLDGMSDARSRRAIAVAERFAEGSADQEELRAAYTDARQAVFESLRAVGKIGSAPHNVALFATEARAVAAAKRVSDWLHSAALVAVWPGRGPCGADREAQFRFFRAIKEDDEAVARAGEIVGAQSSLLHDIVGNPFRPPPPVDSRWLAWNGGTVARLAQAAYDERVMPEGTLDRARLAVLADALEEAGCADAEILGHLRGPGPCVRGCWVVDAILQKG